MLHRTHRRPRRRSALLAAGVLVATPLLTSCGMAYETDKVNTISAGVNERDGGVDVLGAVVIAGEPDVGLFVATLVNNTTAEVTFQGVTASEGGLEPLTEPAALTGVPVPAGGRANLFETGGVPVTGTFGAGDFVSVTVSFEDGQVSTLEIPVVTPCHQYSLDKLTELELPEPPAGAAAEVVESETESEDDHGEELPGPYSCEAAPPVVHGHAEPEGEPAE